MNSLVKITVFFLVFASFAVSAQTRKRTNRSQRSQRSPMAKLQIGIESNYFQSDYLARKVRRLERVVNIMQDRILDLEYQMSYSGGAQQGYFCEVIASFSGKVYTAQAPSKRQAASEAYSKCVNREGSFDCNRNKVYCDPLGQRF